LITENVVRVVSYTTKDGYEPIFQNDFSTGRAKFFLLDNDDVIAIEDILVKQQIYSMT